MSMQTLGTTLAHGLAHRYGRDGSSQIRGRARDVTSIRRRSPGKQSRQAVFKRLNKDIQKIYGEDGVLFTFTSGQKKDRCAIHFLVEPHSDGSHTVFLAMVTTRNHEQTTMPLVHFTLHATARLIQAARMDRPILALRQLKSLLIALVHHGHIGEDQRNLVLIAPGIGWMPAAFDEEKGIIEVRTVITEAALSPWKRTLFQTCSQEQRFFLIDTRLDPRDDIGNHPEKLCIFRPIGP